MKQLFEALAEASDGAFVINRDHEIIFWNAAAESILGYSSKEALGRACFEILGGRDEHGRTLCQRYCRTVIGLMQGQPQPNTDIFARCADGKGCWINVTTFAYPSGERGFGKVIVHLFRDATEKKSNEQFISQIVEASRTLRDRPDRFSLIPPIMDTNRDPQLNDLTPREREVLQQLTHGMSTSEISSTLNISPATTRNHIQSVMSKLNVHSRLEAVAYAYQHGLIDDAD